MPLSRTSRIGLITRRRGDFPWNPSSYADLIHPKACFPCSVFISITHPEMISRKDEIIFM